MIDIFRYAIGGGLTIVGLLCLIGSDGTQDKQTNSEKITFTQGAIFLVGGLIILFSGG